MSIPAVVPQAIYLPTIPPSDKDNCPFLDNSSTDNFKEISQYLSHEDRMNFMKTSSESNRLIITQVAVPILSQEERQIIQKKIREEDNIQWLEVDATETEKRWFELRILEMPPITKLESCKVAMCNLFDKLGLPLTMVIANLAIAVLGVSLFGLIGTGFYVCGLSSLPFSPILLTASLVGDVFGGMILYSLFFDIDKWRVWQSKTFNAQFKINFKNVVFIPSKSSLDKHVYVIKVVNDELNTSTSKRLDRPTNQKFHYLPLLKTTYDALRK